MTAMHISYFSKLLNKNLVKCKMEFPLNLYHDTKDMGVVVTVPTGAGILLGQWMKID